MLIVKKHERMAEAMTEIAEATLGNYSCPGA
jgi:hypothetical protein